MGLDEHRCQGAGAHHHQSLGVVAGKVAGRHRGGGGGAATGQLGAVDAGQRLARLPVAEEVDAGDRR
ncbi:MAG: hypothetical protein U5L11_01295 [Arhodomonas sp.]|nr:hypothetical protein [Arhodomonas sp.]